MPERDWLSTPDDTNIGESAHTLSNLYTGIGLSILEGILRCVLYLVAVGPTYMGSGTELRSLTATN